MTDPIPTTLTEAVDQIIATMSEEDKVRALAEPEDGAFAYAHFFGGMAMRNAWGLWHGETPISKWLRDRGIYHGDDQSGVIFDAVWRRLHNLPIDDAWVAGEAASYADFWRKSGVEWNGTEYVEIPGFKRPKERWFAVKKGHRAREVPPPDDL